MMALNDGRGRSPVMNDKEEGRRGATSPLNIAAAAPLITHWYRRRI